MTSIVNRAADTVQKGSSGELAPLLHGVAKGDRNAFATLYDRTSAKLYGICVRLLETQAEADEVLQDVYVTVWQKADQYDRSKASPITWLAVLARNKAVDRLRRKRLPTDTIEAANDVADESSSALDLIERNEEQRRLNDCLDGLDDRPRAMIRAAFLDGLTYPELAEREAVPLGTMKSWIRRGLARLKDCLER